MYYIEKDNIVIGINEDRKELIAILKYRPDLKEEDIKEVPAGFIAIFDKPLMTISEYNKEVNQAERNRLNMLSMTRGDVFEALILSKGVTKAQIRTMIENDSTLDTITKALYLNRFDEALEFYRGYPIFDLLGDSLDITSDMLDRFFDTKDYHYLSKYTLEIQPTPSEAVVTINGEITNKVTLSYNTEVEYTVSLDNYITQTGKLNLTENKVVEIELQPETPIAQE